MIGAKSAAEQGAADIVLDEFFTATDEGFRQSRCDREIANFYRVREKSRSFWASIPKHIRAALGAKWRAARIEATPPWLTEEMESQIAEKYRQAQAITQETGIPHEVDHVVPLQGRLVRGLHVPWNLRVISAEKNRAKSNFLWDVAE